MMELFRVVMLSIGGMMCSWIGLFIAVIGVIIAWIAPAFTGRLTSKHPIIFSHLLERISALAIIMFGETIIGIADFFTPQNFSIESIFVFIMLVSLFFTYAVEFEHLIDENRHGETGIWKDYLITSAITALVTLAIASLITHFNLQRIRK